MATEKQLYNLLAVPPTASDEEISKAYKKLALKYHPDKTNKNPELTERFKMITKAYGVLKDLQSRNIYDRYGERGLENLSSSTLPSTASKPSAATGPMNPSSNNFPYPGAPPHMPSMSDMFSLMFSSVSGSLFADATTTILDMGMGMRMHMDMINMMGDVFAHNQDTYNRQVLPAPRQKREMVRGADIHHSYNVTLEDLYRGKLVKLRLPKNTKCSSCDGVGGWNPKSCKTCQGHGQIIITTTNRTSQFQELTSCSDCRGTGTFIGATNICTVCHGGGYKKTVKIIKARIYPGLKHNDKIVLRGESDEGRNIIPGDVIITLKEVANPDIVRRDNDLYIESSIDFRTAVLGGNLMIPDFISKGNDLNLIINVHGVKEINDKYDKSIQTGQVLGVIDSQTPRCVPGLGMPISNHKRGGNAPSGEGVYFQVSEEISDIEEPESILLPRGNLYIKFNVIMPSLNDFSPQDLLKLDDVLPPSKKVPGSVKSYHLENIGSCSNREERKAKRPRKNPSGSKKQYNYSDIEADSLDPEKEDEVFYNQQWQTDEH